MMIQTFAAATRRRGGYFFFTICTSTSTAPISSSIDSSESRRGSDLSSVLNSATCTGTGTGTGSSSSSSSSGRRRRSSDASSVASPSSSSSSRRRISNPSRSDSSSSLGETSFNSSSSSSSGGRSSRNSSSSSGSNSQALHRLALLGFSDAFSQARFSSLPYLPPDVPDKLHIFLSSGSSPAQITRRFAKSKHMNLLSTIPLPRLSAYIDLLGPSVLLLRPEILFLTIPNLRSKLQFFQKIGFSPEKIRHYPRLFCMHLGTLKDRFSFLKSLGISKLDLPKCVGRFPYVLCADPVKRIQPIIDFLEKERGLSRKTICKYAVTRPHILTFSIEYLTRKIEFFESLGLDANSSQFYPCIVQLCSLSNILIQTRIDWLMSRGLPREGVIRILERTPLVFACREDNVGGKIDYLLNVLNRNVEEVLYYTSFLTMSLEKRIKPRFSVLAQLQEKGLVDDYSLSVVLNTSNAAFRERFTNLLQAEGTQQKLTLRVHRRKRHETIEAGKESASPVAS